MSSEIGWRNIIDVLNILSENDLHGLTATVTQGLLKEKRKSKQDAIEVILKYSPDVLSILKRRAVTRDVLFTYLHNKNVSIELPTTKDKLVAKVCELWNLTSPKDIKINNAESYDTATSTNSQQVAESAENNVNAMAKQFVRWFYEMMNSNEYIDPSHFYFDARLKLNLISNGTETTEETESANAIVELLFRTKTEYNLFFNPNLTSDGTQGIFEQVFALARDPFSENNWKVKSTELNLRSQRDNVDTPTLTNNELTFNLLSLPSG
ncbi:hypothetical protein Trydic_g17071 [Trypoxylus dichotomus]